MVVCSAGDACTQHGDYVPRELERRCFPLEKPCWAVSYWNGQLHWQLLGSEPCKYHSLDLHWAPVTCWVTVLKYNLIFTYSSFHIIFNLKPTICTSSFITRSIRIICFVGNFFPQQFCNENFWWPQTKNLILCEVCSK